MVVIEFRGPVRDESRHIVGSELLARLSVDGQDARIEGDESAVDFDQRVLSPRTGEAIRFADSGEDWARGLTAAYRSPYLWADIVEDSAPLPDIDVPPVDVELPAREAAGATH
jgi:hypothetical protein